MILPAIVLGCWQALAPLPGAIGAEPAAAEIQEPGPDTREQAKRWWEKLSPEERERFRRRHAEFQRLSPKEREEIRRRLDAVDRQRRRVWSDLPPAERERLSALTPEERGAALDKIVRERLKRRHQELVERFGPGPGPEELRGRPLKERLHASGPLIESLRSEDLLQELARLHEEGWIGARAAEWLKQAPVAEQAAALLDARKWRALALTRRKGLFEKWRLDQNEQRFLAEMPSRDFLIAIRELERGLPKEEVFAPGRPGGPPPFPGWRLRGGRPGFDRPRGPGPDGPARPGIRPGRGDRPERLDRRPGKRPDGGFRREGDEAPHR